jgi:hypothetical protein
MGYRSDSDDDIPADPDPPRVILAKIFMRTLSYSVPIIAEWDGKDPGHTKQLFVYAYIHNSTYQSYVRNRDIHKQYDSLMHTELLSYIHNPLSYDAYIYPRFTELATLLPNLMSGNLSFPNSRDVRDKHRIYVFDPPPTMGIESNWHPQVTNPVYTYWYRLNNLSGQDHVTEGPPDVETIRDIPEEEFDLNYGIFQNFRPDNADIFLLKREPKGNGTKLKGVGKKPLYPPLHNPNRGRGNVHGHSRGHDPIFRRGGKKNSKRRNKTRRKYRKIKSRRRRVIR